MPFYITDAVENSEEYKKIKDELEKKIIAEVGERDSRGYCHRYWRAKKKILAEEYGISWRSPAELNPKMHFD